MKHYALQVTTLSPVHVATGEAMQPGDYLVHDERLYEFGRWGLSRALTAHQRKELLQLLDSESVDLPLQVQRFLARESGSLCAAAERMRPLLPGIAAYCQGRLGQQMQARTGHRPATINQLELMRQIGAEFSQPYIPGSTLKGSIRGALLGFINKQQSPSENLSSHFDPKHLKSEREEQRILNYQGIDDDPFRFLLVGDAVKTRDKVVELDYWLVNRLRLAPKAGKEQNTNLQFAPVECIAPLQTAALSLELRLKPEPLPGCIKNPALKTMLTDFPTLAKSVNQITLSEFLNELNWLEQNNIATEYAYAPQYSWVKAMRTLLQDENIQQQLIKGEAMLLRVGKYGGAISKTVRGWRHIKRMAGKGEKPTYHPDVMTKCLALPKEKAFNQGLPFGWVLLQETPSQSLQELLAPLCQSQEQQRRQQIENWLQSRSVWLEQRQVEEAAHQAKEQAKAAEAEEQKRKAELKASLSPAGQKMIELEDGLAEAKRFGIKDPTGSLRHLLNQCVALVATEGSDAEKADMKTLFTEIINYWGVDRKKNAKLKELWGKLA